MRSVDDMIAGRNAPTTQGLTLADISHRQCRFPVSGDGAQTLFCAAEIPHGDWMPGASGGSYCSFHKDLARGRGTDAERRAHRDLKRRG